jgi:hypothetical protein
MAIKPTLFVVFDIETTLKHRIAFDVAWKTIDRRGRVYGRGSYIIREAFEHDVPFFKEKLGHYFDDAFAHRVTPESVIKIRDEFNRQIAEFQYAGHRVIACAYNAAFDSKYLPETIQKLSNNPNERWMQQPVELLDIWDYWGESVPLNYSANPSASGKWFSTSAESAYRFEFCQEDFEEYHRAWHDVEIEANILLKALARKKPMPVVKSPRDFAGAVWRKINTRLGVDGTQMLAPV